MVRCGSPECVYVFVCISFIVYLPRCVHRILEKLLYLFTFPLVIKFLSVSLVILMKTSWEPTGLGEFKYQLHSG